MHSLLTFDVIYAIRQLSIVTALIIAPAVLFSWLRTRRVFLLVVAPAAVLVGLWFLFQTFATSASVWERSALPYTPFKVGPSYLSLLDLWWVLVLTLWAPFGVFWTAGATWRRRRRAQPLRLPAITLLLCLYMLAATTVTTFIMIVTEYAHEDTVFADGFSLSKWRKAKPGMTRSEVHALLGEPLHGHCSFAPDAECWVANFSAGHFAAVWFQNEKASRVYRWYSD